MPTLFEQQIEMVMDCHDVDERIRRAFEADWRAGSARPIEDYLPDACDPSVLATLEELVSIELELTWKSRRGDRPLVEQYLRRFPQLSTRPVVLRLVQEEYAVRTRFDSSPALDEYRSRFPQWKFASDEILGEQGSTAGSSSVESSVAPADEAADPYATVMLALEQCSALGYRRPGLAHIAPINERLAYRWESAYRTGCEKMGFGKNLPLLMLPRWDAGSVIPWLQKKRPDVILGNFYEDELEKIEAAGLRVPHDIGIVGLSVKSMDSSISGIFQDGQLLGATAADKLIDLVERNEIGVPSAPFTLTFHPRWNPGRTLRRPA